MSEKKDLILGGQGGGSSSGTPNVTPDTLYSLDVIEFVLGISEGPIGGLLDGAKTLYVEDTPLVSQAGSLNFEDFRLDLYHGANPASPVLTNLGGVSSNTVVGVSLAQNTPVIRTTPVGARNTIDFLEIRLTFNSLLKTNAEGDQLEETADFQLQYRESGSGTWLNFYPSYPNLAITGKTVSGYTKDFAVWVPRVNNDWEIRVVKLSPDNEQYRTIEMTWESFQVTEWTQDTYNNLAVVRGLARASDQLSSVPSISGVFACQLVNIPSNYDPVTRYYNGVWDGTFKVGHTDNPAWILYDILTNTRYGLKYHYPDLLVDRYSFYDAAQWCDQFVPIPNSSSYQPRWTYSDKIDQARDALETANYIAGVFGGILTSDRNGSVVLKVDRPTPIVQVFGPEAITEEGFQYQFTDVSERKNDILVKFRNPHLDWNEDIRRVYVQSEIDANGRIPAEMVAVGCINPYEAERRAHRRILQATTEKITVSFSTARAGLILDLFDTIGINDPDMNWGLSGRVVSVAGSTITLRDPLTVPVSTAMSMKISTPTGYTEIQVTSNTAVTTELNILSGTWPANAADKAFFTLSEVNNLGLTKPFRVLSIKEDDTNPDLVNITALEINSLKYGDNDSLNSSGTIDFQYRQPLIPTNPTDVIAESGTEHLYKKADGTIVSRMFVYWNHSPQDLSPSYRVYYRPVNYASFQSFDTDLKYCYITDVIDGVQYEVYIRAIGKNGQLSSKSTSVYHTVIGKTALPATPTNFQTFAGVDTVSLTVDASTELDFKHFNYYASIASPTTPILIGSTASNILVYRPNPGDNYTQYAVEAVDTSGNKSPLTSWSTVSPAGVTNSDLSTEVDDRINSMKSTYTAHVYQRAASQPATPTGGSFNFGTNVLTPPSGWSASVPGSDGNPCWVTTYTFSITGDTGTDTATTWGVPTIVFTDGDDGVNGADGQSVFVYQVYQRAASPPGTPTGGSYNFGTNTGTPPTGWSNSVPAADGNPLYVSLATASVPGATGVDSSLTWTAPILASLDGADGSDGQSTFAATIYQRAASPPSAPTGGTFNFGTNTLTPPSGWSIDIPASNGNPCYACSYTFSIIGDTGTDTAGTWGTPASIVDDGSPGAPGADGLSVYQYSVYRRAASPPATPTGGSYNFGTNTGTPPTNWSNEPPASDGNPLYVSQATASVQGTTGTDSSLTWSTVALVVQDGATGASGTDGKSTFTGVVYQRAASPPSAPTGGTFNFGTNVLTPPSGWAIDIPNSDGNPCYACSYTFSIVGDTGTDTAGTWGTPTEVVSDGTDGLDGVSTYRYVVFKRSAVAVSTPTGGSYDFTNNIGTPPTGWSNNPPADDGNPLYVSETTAQINGPTGVDSSLTWTTPTVLVTSGSDGVRGPGRWNIGVTTLPSNSSEADSEFQSATGLSPVNSDQAWFYTGTESSPTSQGVWLFNGTSWVEQAEAVDGNLLVNGTVTAAALATSSVTTDKLAAGSITADKLEIGSASNWITNSNFAQGSDGWGFSSDLGGSTESAINFRGAGSTWAGNTYPTLSIYQNGGNSLDQCYMSYTRLFSSGYAGMAVTPGDRLEISAWLSTHRCTAGVYVNFYDASGAYLSTLGGGVTGQKTNTAGDSANPELWPRVYAFVTVPANAATAAFVLVKTGTIGGFGWTDSHAIIHKPMMGFAPANATTPSPYSEGGGVLIDSGGIKADAVTADKMAANSITAANGAIADLTVDTLKIADNAVSVLRQNVIDVTTTTNDFTIGAYLSFSIPRACDVMILYFAELENNDSVAQTVNFYYYYEKNGGGDVLRESKQGYVPAGAGNYAEAHVEPLVLNFTGSGTCELFMAYDRQVGSGSMIIRQAIMAWTTFK